MKTIKQIDYIYWLLNNWYTREQIREKVSKLSHIIVI